MSHVLVVANETVGGRGLIEALERRAGEGGVELITVLAPVNNPRDGYVVYEDSRRAAAGRRLERTLEVLRAEKIPAHGMVVESDPADAVRDALHQLEPPPTEILVSTHPLQKSGWLRKNVLDRIRAAAPDLPIEHVVVDMAAEAGQANVLVIANETVGAESLLARIRERAAASGKASFLIVSPQSGAGAAAEAEAERRLRGVLADLRAHGVEVHGQIAHPDPFTAALHAVGDERIDEIIVSTFPGQRSGWLRRDLVERLRRETDLPVDHVVSEGVKTPA